MSTSRTLLARVALPLAIYCLLEWAFAYVTLADGLVTPHGAPNLGVLAIGFTYLGLRLVVHLVVPGVAAFTLVERALHEVRKNAERSTLHQ